MRAQSTPGGVGVDVVSVSKSDSTVYDPTLTALYVGTGGDVAIVTLAGNTAIFKNVPDGGYVLCRCAKVLDTGTSAQDIVGLY